jgi:hypothetical protein
MTGALRLGRAPAALLLVVGAVCGLVAGCGAGASSDSSASPGGPRASGGSGADQTDGVGGRAGLAGAGGTTSGGSAGAAAGTAGAQGGLAGAGGTTSGGSAGTAGAQGGLAGTTSATSGGSAGGGGAANAGGGAAGSTTVGCGRPREQVSVGGVEGFESFVDASHSAQLRACGASLYIHQVGWGGLSVQQRRQIAANFTGTGGVSLEMAEATDLQTDYFDLGIASIDEILVNAPTCEVPEVDMAVDVWQGWVTQWKAKGIKRAEYNDTPNCHFPVNWDDSKWDASKDRARIGGGVILDSPPYFYYDVGPDDYRAFVRAEIAWANANGLHSSWILSPGGDLDFLTETERLIAEINALPPNERPQQWIVESYGAGGPVGDENVAGSVANVALWVVNNAQVYQP